MGLLERIFGYPNILCDWCGKPLDIFDTPWLQGDEMGHVDCSPPFISPTHKRNVAGTSNPVSAGSTPAGETTLDG